MNINNEVGILNIQKRFESDRREKLNFPRYKYLSKNKLGVNILKGLVIITSRLIHFGVI